MSSPVRWRVAPGTASEVGSGRPAAGESLTAPQLWVLRELQRCFCIPCCHGDPQAHPAALCSRGVPLTPDSLSKELTFATEARQRHLNLA